MLLAIDDPLVILGRWRRWRAERPQNPVRNRRPSHGSGRAAAPARAWSALRILFVIDDPLMVFGASWRWRVERPPNSVRNRGHSRGFRRLTALARGASSQVPLNRSTSLELESTFS